VMVLKGGKIRTDMSAFLVGLSLWGQGVNGKDPAGGGRARRSEKMKKKGNETNRVE